MQEKASNGAEYKIYRRRWVILSIFVLFCICNAVQWIQYSVIVHIFVKYYDVGSNAIDWTSLIYMITFVIFILPATWLLNIKVSFENYNHEQK
jgi:MFS transporter, FLVCR family, feline leukemia virus subgroup C receptor-related protein